MATAFPALRRFLKRALVDQNLQPGARRRSTFDMSRMAAPLGEVTSPIRRGNFGNGRLRSGAKSPSASSLRLSVEFAGADRSRG